jgi:hypothetical protein
LSACRRIEVRANCISVSLTLNFQVDIALERLVGDWSATRRRLTGGISCVGFVAALATAGPLLGSRYVRTIVEPSSPSISRRAKQNCAGTCGPEEELTRNGLRHFPKN